MEMNKGTKKIIKKGIVSFVCAFSIFGLVLFSLSMWLLFQPISFGIDNVIDPLKESEIIGNVTEIKKEEYSINDLKESTGGYLEENDFYFAPASLHTEKAEFFVYCTSRERYGGRKTLIIREIYIKTFYNDEEKYSDEKEHTLKKEYPTIKQPQFTKTLFSFDALIFIYNDESEFVYVLFDDINLNIVYVSFQGLFFVSNIVFGQQYIPSKRLWDSDFPKRLIKGHAYNCF